jgi:hypothetical protein
MANSIERQRARDAVIEAAKVWGEGRVMACEATSEGRALILALRALREAEGESE